MHQVFAALDSDVRRQILVYLATEDLTFVDICARLDITAPAVLRHLKILEEAGLVTREQGRSTPYALVSENLIETFNAFLGTVHHRVRFEPNRERLRSKAKDRVRVGRSGVKQAATT